MILLYANTSASRIIAGKRYLRSACLEPQPLSTEGLQIKRSPEPAEASVRWSRGEHEWQTGSGLLASPSTLLLELHYHAAAVPVTAPRVLGIDDLPWKKGHSYGTILCDLEKREVVDLHPDREAGKGTATVVPSCRHSRLAWPRLLFWSETLQSYPDHCQLA